MSSAPPDMLCATAVWSQRTEVNWVEVDKRDCGVLHEWGLGPFSISNNLNSSLGGHHYCSGQNK